MRSGIGNAPASGWAGFVAELHVGDIDASLSFWRDVLASVAYQRPTERFVYLERADGSQVMLCEQNARFETGAMKRPLGRGVMLQLYVDDLEAVLERLAARALTIYLGPRESWWRKTSARAHRPRVRSSKRKTTTAPRRRGF